MPPLGEERSMTRLGVLASAMVALVLAVTGAQAETGPVKIGIVAAFTGPYSIWGTEYKRGIELFLDKYNGKDGNPQVEIVYRDDGGDNPARAKQLAQELIVRDHVAVLGGEEFTPNALAMTDVINEAKMPFVIFNAATGFITDRSPYFVRTAFTLWTNTIPDAKWALQNKIAKVDIVSADYAPGTDAVNAFSKVFTEGGGTVVNVIRVPLGTADFSPYLQRIRDDNVQGLYMFMPNGPMSVGLVKAFAPSGLGKKVQLMAAAETEERDLKQVGDAALGIISSMCYGPYLDNPANTAFVAAYRAKFGNQMPPFQTVLAWDGMMALMHMVKATGGKPDGDAMMAAIKGYAWDSPRGPVSVDPNTRELTQNMYVRRVEKRPDGTLYNKDFFTYHNVKELWHELNPKKKS